MPRECEDNQAPEDATEMTVPQCAPAWITPELIRETILVWQPYYSESITPEAAYTILQNTGRLLDVLFRG
jgi:hypothetical protein